MILLDVNVLVFAHRSDFPMHEKAYPWLMSALIADEPVAVWDVAMTSAYRILSNPKIVREPDAGPTALQFLNEVRAASTAIGPGERYWDILCRMLVDSRATGNLVSDAAIGALAIEQGCRLATFDRDFARFQGLQWFEPA